MADEIDKTLMQEFKAHADELYNQHAGRDEDFELYEDAYLMKWAEDNKSKFGEHMRLTASPDAHNQVLGEVRLMNATEPQFNISDLCQVEVPDSEKVEKYIGRSWTLGGRRKGEPLNNSLTLCAILYDEIHATIVPIQEQLEIIRKRVPEGNTEKKYHDAKVKQWEEASETEQFLIEPLNPKGGYPEYGQLGLTAYHRREEVTVSMLRSKFGSLPKAYDGMRPSDKVLLYTWMDDVYTAYWTDKGDIYMGEHGYGFVPAIAQLVDGSNIFSSPEDQRHPLLYALIKSGLWDAQNMALTIMYTSALAMGSVTKFVYSPSQPGNRLNFHWDEEYVELNPGDSFGPIDLRNIIPQSLSEAYQLATQKGEQSTIYQQALGGMAEKASTYSETALFAQAGRLPLIGPQRRGGWAISKIIEQMFAIARSKPSYLSGSDLTTADIPRGIMVDTKLEVKLPQERLQMANVGKMLGELGVSNEWILTNIIGINNPQELRRQRWNEQSSEIMYQQRVQQLVQQAQQQAQMQQQRPPTQPDMQGAPMPQGGPAPQSGPMMSQGQGKGMGGLPPQQAGVMPGMGEAVAPEGMG